MRQYLSFAFLIFLLPALNITITSAQESIRLDVSQYDGVTSKDDSTWAMMEVQSDNKYSLTKNQGQKAIKATSENAAGGLNYITRIDPKEYPIIEWRWKVNGVIEKAISEKRRRRLSRSCLYHFRL